MKTKVQSKQGLLEILLKAVERTPSVKFDNMFTYKYAKVKYIHILRAGTLSLSNFKRLCDIVGVKYKLTTKEGLPTTERDLFEGFEKARNLQLGGNYMSWLTYNGIALSTAKSVIQNKSTNSLGVLFKVVNALNYTLTVEV